MLRKLGYWETFKKLTHDLCNNSESIAAVIELSGEMSFIELKASIYKVFSARPLLRARIVELEGDYYFNFDVEFKNILLKELSVNEENEWQKLLNEELNTPFEIGQSLWRLSFLRINNQRNKYAIIGSFHHSITDGIAVIAFFHELLSDYGSSKGHHLTEASNIDIPGSIETRLRSTRPIERYLKEIPVSSIELTPTPYQSWVQIEHRKTKILPLMLDEKLSQRLIAYAQQEKTTTHNILGANMLLTAQRVLNKPINVSMSTPVSLRDFCNPKIEAEEIGCFVAVTNTIYENISAETSLNELAQMYGKKLIKNVPKYIRLPREYEVQDVSNIYSLTMLKNKQDFDLTLAITDVKEANLHSHYGPLQITQQIAGVTLNYGLVTMLLGVGLLNERFMCCFNYVEPLISTEWARLFLSKFNEHLIQQFLPE